jgi:phosphatidylinositol kinase/protein kinase (PI-3  family)
LNAKVIQSKECPLAIEIFGTSKKKYKFLLKNVNNDDIRKEARFINFVQYINELID